MLQLIWFSTILRVAYRVITGRGAEDARSDDEEYVCFIPSFAIPYRILIRPIISEEDEDDDDKKDQ